MTPRANSKTARAAKKQCEKCGMLLYITKAKAESAEAVPCDCVQSCSQCGGTGYIDEENETGYTTVKPCECQSLYERIELYNRAMIPARYYMATLEGFEELNDTLVAVKYEVLKYRQTFEMGTPGLLISGPPGTGKTHLMCALLAYLTLERGIRCRFIDFGHFTTLIKQGYNQRMSENEIIDALVDVPVLCVDELGKGRATDWEISVLDALVNRRYNAGVSTLFTTNYPTKFNPEGPEAAGFGKGKKIESIRDPFNPEQVERLKQKVAFQTLEDRVGVRIFSRLQEMCSLITIEADDYRKTHAPRSPMS